MLESGFASGTATDGQDDVVFEPGDEVEAGAWGGSYDGTIVLNGVRFVVLDASGPIRHLIGNAPPGYEPVDGVDSSGLDDSPFTVCFAAGTRILTDRGEVPVESLRAGGMAATLGLGGAPFAPVLFVGERRIRLAGHRHAAELAPIRIRAGALGWNTPQRDLLVSSDHCLFLSGALVPARLLVNGSTITVERGRAEVAYHHIELPRHDVVLAEGAPAESWLDCGNRAWFANAPGALLRVEAPLAAHATGATVPCAPMLQAGPALAAIRDRIALRTAALVVPHAA